MDLRKTLQEIRRYYQTEQPVTSVLFVTCDTQEKALRIEQELKQGILVRTKGVTITLRFEVQDFVRGANSLCSAFFTGRNGHRDYLQAQILHAYFQRPENEHCQHVLSHPWNYMAWPHNLDLNHVFPQLNYQ